MHADGKSMVVKFEFEKPPVFEKRVLTSWASKNPQMSVQLIMHARPPLSHSFGSSCTFSFTLWQFYSFFLMARKSFLVMPNGWENRSMIWGFVEVIFASINPLNVSWNCITHSGCFPHFPFSFLAPKAFFLNPITCILLCVHPLFWYELVWSGIGWESAW